MHCQSWTWTQFTISVIFTKSCMSCASIHCSHATHTVICCSPLLSRQSVHPWTATSLPGLYRGVKWQLPRRVWGNIKELSIACVCVCVCLVTQSGITYWRLIRRSVFLCSLHTALVMFSVVRAKRWQRCKRITLSLVRGLPVGEPCDVYNNASS